MNSRDKVIDLMANHVNWDACDGWLDNVEDALTALLDEHAAEARGDTFECPYCGTVTKWQLKDASGESDDNQ